jgi:fatty-acyl-CoA synthase
MLPDEFLNPVTLDEILLRRAAREPDSTAIVMAEDGHAVTLSELRRWAGAAASFLAAKGIARGERIAIWGQNSVGWAVWLCGASWRGIGVVALHPLLAEEDLALSVEQALPTWLIVDETCRGRNLAEIAARVAGPRGLTIMPGGDGLPDFRSVLDPSEPVPERLGRPEDVLNLQFTSGSTGRPKLVALSQRALITNAVQTARGAGIGPGDSLCSPLPLFHSAGISSGLILSLATGAPWCTTHRFRPDSALTQINANGCTVLQGVPTMFKGLLDLMDQSGADTPSLRLGFIGGAPCPPDLSRRAIDRLGLERMVVTYGQTEFGPTMALSRGDEPADLALTSAGPPMPGTQMRIVDPASGLDAEPEAEGEIWVRGPTRMEGYLFDAAATGAAVTPDGWLRTGDLGRIVRGCVQITARLKELIIRGGENVSPYEVEDALRGAAGMADICVVPVPSAHWGEEICAVILRQPAQAPDLTDLAARAERKLARYKRPDRYVVVDELPSLPSGKIDRVAVRKRMAQGVSP